MYEICKNKYVKRQILLNITKNLDLKLKMELLRYLVLKSFC